MTVASTSTTVVPTVAPDGPVRIGESPVTMSSVFEALQAYEGVSLPRDGIRDAMMGPYSLESPPSLAQDTQSNTKESPLQETPLALEYPVQPYARETVPPEQPGDPRHDGI